MHFSTVIRLINDYLNNNLIALPILFDLKKLEWEQRATGAIHVRAQSYVRVIHGIQQNGSKYGN